MITQHPISKDSRYTITKEFCGHRQKRFVVRFCGEWICQTRFYTSAIMVAVGHNTARLNPNSIIVARE